MSNREIRKTICPLDCPDTCAMLASVENGRVVSLTGDPDHPVTRGHICQKMRAYPQRCHSPQRITWPALRDGKKGEGKFRRIGWPEALDLLAEKLADTAQHHGGEAILPYFYAGNMGYVNRFAGEPLFARLGASRLDQTICSAAAGSGWRLHCGGAPGTPPEVAAEAELIVLWGINSKVTNVHFWQYVVQARKNGAKLLVIDPYRNQTGHSADIYQPVSPGGDSALALGLSKALMAAGSCHTSYLQEETSDYDLFARQVAALSWQEIEVESGVARSRVEELAMLLAANPKTFLRLGIGLSRNRRGAMAVRAITALGACLGLFSGGAGRGVLLTAGAFKVDRQAATPGPGGNSLPRLINMIHLGQALSSQQPPVKLLFVYNANPLSANPDTALVRSGLEREDLFTVVHEQVLTPTARYADLLLPATTFLENHDLYTAYGHFWLGVARPVIPPVGEAWSNYRLFQELATKMGLTDPVLQQTPEERIIAYLQHTQGLPAGGLELALAGKPVRSTNWPGEAGNFIGQKEGYRFEAQEPDGRRAVPGLGERGEFGDPDLLGRFPYRLIIPPHPKLLNSTFGERYEGEYGTVLIHPEDADRQGISQGELVLLKNFRGYSYRQAQITTDTQPGLLVAEGIFWPATASSAINDLTSQKITDLGGGATFHESLVALEKLAPDN